MMHRSIRPIRHMCDSATSFLRSLVGFERATTQSESVNEGDLFDRIKDLGDVIPERCLIEEFGAALHRRFAE